MPSLKLKFNLDFVQWVESTNLAWIGSQGEDLIVAFRNGAVYRYEGAEHMLNAIVEARSAGGEFNRFKHLFEGEVSRICDDWNE